MATNVKQMMEAANAAVPKITPAQAREMIAKGNTLVVDVRDAPEVEKSGKVAGAVHVSRCLAKVIAQAQVWAGCSTLSSRSASSPTADSSEISSAAVVGRVLQL